MSVPIIEAIAIKIEGLIFMRKDVNLKNLPEFIKIENLEYVESRDDKKGNIKIDFNREHPIILQEWVKYKVIATESRVFEEKDFAKNGEFGTEKYGTIIFKNCLGLARFKKIIFNVESAKLNPKQYESLVESVNHYISNLAYDFNQSTYSKIGRDFKKNTDLSYHTYLLIMNMMSSKDKSINLFSNLKLIDANPHRQMITTYEYDSIYKTPGITFESIIDIFSGQTSFVPVRNPKNKLAKKITNGTDMYLPDEICLEEIIDSYDNNENRFIKYFITFCLRTIQSYNDKFTQIKGFLNFELLENNKNYIGELKTLLNNTFLKEVGDLQTIPMYSTVLTRRDGYRQLFKMYLGLKAIPMLAFESKELEEMIENKSLDVLYENYCYFTIAQVLCNIYGETLQNKRYKVAKTDFNKTLEKKTDANYFVFEAINGLPKVKLYYNKNYNKNQTYSKPFDPDISIEFLDESEEVKVICLFDAKFKADIYNILEEEEVVEEQRKFKYDDISKMHTYKDAIKLARGAYILYPGTENEIFSQEEIVTTDNKYKGVGALGVMPGESNCLEDTLIEIIEEYKKII